MKASRQSGARVSRAQGRVKLAVCALGAAIAACFSPGATALPNGAQVAAGQAALQQQAGQLTITNSPGAIINWQSFSIAAQEAVRFQQASASSAVLNRVIGSGGNILRSDILGSLSSNGRVFLLNPAGVLIGPGARIDTAAFVASTLSMTDEDFLAGRLKFSGGPGASDIVNQGVIAAGRNGDILLVAPNIENSGVIRSEGGRIILAAGEEVSITSPDLAGVRFDVQAPDNSVRNLGSVVSAGGAVGMFAGTLHHSGAISANSVTVGESGRIVLAAAKNIELASGSSVSANGPEGGSVSVQSATGDVYVAGSVEARGSAGGGGNVDLLGTRVALLDGAKVDVSGRGGGGRVRVGGDYHGGDVQRAEYLYMDRAATIRADAQTSGDGGRVVLWSQLGTRFDGTVFARGGAAGGNGGFVETSSAGVLQAAGLVHSDAPRGLPGTWLLDPADVLIGDTDAGGGFSVSNPTVFTSIGSASSVSAANISNALNAGTSVTITTNSSDGSGAGDITVASSIAHDTGGAVTLALQADRDIVVNGGVQIGGSATTNVVLDAALSGDGVIALQPGASIRSAGGNIALGGGIDPTVSPARGRLSIDPAGGSGILLSGATLDAAGGNISLIGSATMVSSAAGVSLSGSTLSTTGAGSIRIEGTGGLEAGFDNRGVYISGSSLSTQHGDISIIGTGQAFASTSDGIFANGSTRINASGSGSIQLTGSASGSASSAGISLADATQIETQGGSIVLDGNANESGAGNYGVVLFSGTSGIAPLLRANGSGGISITGNDNAGSNPGVYLTSAGTSVEAPGGGTIEITAGTAFGSSALTFDSGVSISGSGALVLQPSTGSADISIGAVSANSVFHLDAGNLAALQAGFTSMTVGRAGPDAVGNVHVGDLASGDIPANDLIIQGGDVLVEGSLGSSVSTFNHNLTLRANAEILFTPGVSINASGGPYDIKLFANSDGINGRIVMDGVSVLSGGGQILLCGADCTQYAEGVGGGSSSDADYGILIRNSVVDAWNVDTGTGDIQIRGRGVGEGGAGAGVHIEGSTINAANLTIDGVGGAFGSGGATGVEILANSLVVANAGALSITGVGGNFSSGSGDHGILIAGGSTLLANWSTDISLTGTGGSLGSSANYGVWLDGGSSISSSSGAISITGFGGGFSAGSGDDASGVVASGNSSITSAGGAITISGFGAYFASASFVRGVVLSDTQVSTDGSGTIWIQGTGGDYGSPADGLGNSHGVHLAGSTVVQTADGWLEIDGTATDTSGLGGSAGVVIDGPALVQTTGAGSIGITGTGAPSGFSNTGVLLRGTGAALSALGSGNISVTGTQRGSAGGGGGGIYLASGASISASSGGVDLTGSGVDTEAGIAILGPVGGASQSGHISLTADLLAIDASVGLVQTGSIATLQPLSSGNSVALGSVSSGVTTYAPSLLSRVHAGTLELRTLGGDIMLDADLASADIAAGDLLLSSGGTISLSSTIGTLASPFDHPLTANAQFSINVFGNGQVVLADGRNLTLNADLAGEAVASLNIGGSSGSTLLQVGSSGANTGYMTLTGTDININCFSDCSSTTVRVLGSGSQTLTASTGNITLDATSGPVTVDTGGGTQTLRANGSAGQIEVYGPGATALLQSLGSQVIETSGMVHVAAGSVSGAHAKVLAETGQSITAQSLSIQADGGNDALVQNNATSAQNSSTQSITIVQTLPGTSGITVENLGSGIAALSNLATGPQLISVQDASAVSVAGHGGIARIDAAGNQTLSLTGMDGNALDVGASDAQAVSVISAGGTQSITAGSVNLGVGNGAGSDALITAGLNQSITASGDINLYGTDGSSIGLALAGIQQTGGSLQSLTAASLTVQGNAAVQSAAQQQFALSGDLLIRSGGSGGQSALIDAQSGQTVTARSLTVTALGGSDALLRNLASGAQVVTILNAAAGTGVEIRNAGSGGVAAVENLGGNQTLTVTDSAGVTVLGSAATAKIYAAGSQSLQISGSAPGLSVENLLVVGDYGSGSGLSAIIAGGNQTITAGSDPAHPGEIQLYAGNASGAHAQITSGGTQSLATAGQLRLEGSNGDGNVLTSADVRQTGTGLQDISAGSVVMSGLTTISSADSQNLNIGGGITVAAGDSAGEHAQILAANGQTLSATALSVQAAAGNNAVVRNSGISGIPSDQTITINGPGSLFYGIDVTSNGGGTAEVSNLSTGGAQFITVTDSSGGVRIAGDSGYAHVYVAGAQTLTISGSGSNDLFVGSGTGPAELRADGTQTIVAGASGESGNIAVHGGSVASNLSFISAGGTQSISTSGFLTLTAGSAERAILSAGSDQTITAGGDINLLGSNGASTPVLAHIQQVGSGTQHLTANALALHGFTEVQSAAAQTLSLAGAMSIESGSAAGENARVLAVSGQDVTANSLAIHSVGGNDAVLRNTGSGTQTMTIANGGLGGGLSVVNNGPGGLAALENLGGSQVITLTDASNLYVIGRAGEARIQSAGAQTLAMTGSGSNYVQVGEGGATGRSSIEAGGAQSITAGSGIQSGTISLIAGSDSGFDAVLSAGGTQTLSTTGAIGLAGSYGGTPGQQANAQVVQTAGGEQHVSASSLNLTGLSTVASATSQRVDLSGPLNILSGTSAGEDAVVAAETGQVVNATSLSISSQGPTTAGLINNATQSGNTSAQSVTLTSSISDTNGLQVRSDASGGTALLANYGTGGQSISLVDGNGVSLYAAGTTKILSGGAQTLDVRGSASGNYIQLSTTSPNSTAIVAMEAAGDQTITAGAGGEFGLLWMSASAVGADTRIVAGGNQTISTQQGVWVEGTNGAAATDIARAHIDQGGGGTQTITTGGLLLLTGASAITSAGAQSLSAGGGVTLQAGATAGEDALVSAATSQTITSGDSVTVTAGGASNASILAGANQTIDAVGTLSISGSNGASVLAVAEIVQSGGTAQSLSGAGLTLSGATRVQSPGTQSLS
ncbi:MAG: filamentous hemagglutinin N-terminal domain-containing protein, partial [Rhodocyclaceae bacterium]|nr:filamentous hemagglutinin N-terminal domain-containing protein [Rhodocyclaceae bacterium]